jgi:hypothetical protein
MVYDPIVVCDGDNTVGINLNLECAHSTGNPEKQSMAQKRNQLVVVNDTMQSNYSYYRTKPIGRWSGEYPGFAPAYTPRMMLRMGVFEGKYLNDCHKEFPASWFDHARVSLRGPDVSCNYFGVKSRMTLNHWQSKGWIIGPDPRGWFQWYCRFYMGRRIPHVDNVQITRWKRYKRHYAQVVKRANGNLHSRQKQRQGLLQWSWPCTD